MTLRFSNEEVDLNGTHTSCESCGCYLNRDTDDFEKIESGEVFCLGCFYKLNVGSV